MRKLILLFFFNICVAYIVRELFTSVFFPGGITSFEETRAPELAVTNELVGLNNVIKFTVVRGVTFAFIIDTSLQLAYFSINRDLIYFAAIANLQNLLDCYIIAFSNDLSCVPAQSER